jgi:hypothetical protein
MSLQHLEEDSLLGGKVVVKARLRCLAGLANIDDSRGVRALGGKYFGRCRQNLVADIVVVLGARSCDVCGPVGYLAAI